MSLQKSWISATNVKKYKGHTEIMYPSSKALKWTFSENCKNSNRLCRVLLNASRMLIINPNIALLLLVFNEECIQDFFMIKGFVCFWVSVLHQRVGVDYYEWFWNGNDPDSKPLCIKLPINICKNNNTYNARRWMFLILYFKTK